MKALVGGAQAEAPQRMKPNWINWIFKYILLVITG